MDTIDELKAKLVNMDTKFTEEDSRHSRLVDELRTKLMEVETELASLKFRVSRSFTGTSNFIEFANPRVTHVIQKKGDDFVAQRLDLTEIADGDLDNVPEGSTYGKVKLDDLTTGRVDFDKLQDGTTYAKVKVDDLTTGRIDFDKLQDGTTYARLKVDDLTSGRVDFAKLTKGTLDDVLTKGNTTDEDFRTKGNIYLDEDASQYQSHLYFHGTDATLYYHSSGYFWLDQPIYSPGDIKSYGNLYADMHLDLTDSYIYFHGTNGYLRYHYDAVSTNRYFELTSGLQIFGDLNGVEDLYVNGDLSMVAGKKVDGIDVSKSVMSETFLITSPNQSDTWAQWIQEQDITVLRMSVYLATAVTPAGGPSDYLIFQLSDGTTDYEVKFSGAGAKDYLQNTNDQDYSGAAAMTLKTIKSGTVTGGADATVVIQYRPN